MNPIHVALVVSIGLFVGIMVCLELGYRLGGQSWQKTPNMLTKALG